MGRYPSRGSSGLHTIGGGGQAVQDVARMKDVEGERDQQLAYMHPFRGGYLLGQLRR
jgi:hypothetical protein